MRWKKKKRRETKFMVLMISVYDTTWPWSNLFFLLKNYITISVYVETF